jgi:hypothetical protein
VSCQYPAVVKDAEKAVSRVSETTPDESSRAIETSPQPRSRSINDATRSSGTNAIAPMTSSAKTFCLKVEIARGS